MLNLRTANVTDHEFLVRIDLKDEGMSTTIQRTQQEKDEHSERMLTYVNDPDKGAFIFEDSGSGKQMGLIMYSIVNRDFEYPWKTIFNELDRDLFQDDGRFMEIFQLWVHPSCRRMGLATKLKLEIEESAQTLGVNLIYTHTEETNHHVIELNKKLGYQEIRRGPIWDQIIRVSLIKHLING